MKSKNKNIICNKPLSIINLYLNRRNLLMKKIILNLFIICNLIEGQVSIESIPKSFLSNKVFIQDEIILPSVNIEELIEEDRLEMESTDIIEQSKEDNAKIYTL